ncbi:pyridoxal-phosphate dependent enzyme [Synoicihabitans lomoniglobus]|uniref:threonine ammonia-lyase n=1 Tax=Synoicihabitans lomoniglobus TaxID=2909285 RepID=A0AAE9ZW10_9BACT|nr:pyridoxal-phosphate dependent enzyme [Opitutaceae bacterium LMO-M01]WED65266.1 pyridoxal-phosphate dependent enzyme [Opitutaceae bacterium LMO-M01]
MSNDDLPLDRQLRQGILFARERVYHYGQPTPLERLILPGDEPGPEVWVKREDLSPVNAYKWRGACNRMALLTAAERAQGVVAASAGNHAQGVALAARQLSIRARIHMPRSTPRVKQDAVRHHGGEWVTIVLSGDSYDEAYTSARREADDTGTIYIHAYDDLQVMAGQGTMADEVIMSGHGPFDTTFLQIGGGGLAAAASAWWKTFWPDMAIVGVEAEGQASMQAALAAGEPVTLDQVDIFCDGTAVRRAGDLPFAICRDTLDRVETVSNAEVSTAIRVLWESLRCIAEPSGALGLAAVLKHRAALDGQRVLIVVTGANVDFRQIGLIAQTQGNASRISRTLRIRLTETRGSMLGLLGRCLPGLNVVDFQYGKNDAVDAWPIFTVSADDPAALDTLPARLAEHGYEWEPLESADDVQFRAIPLRGDLLHQPAFFRLDFYERPGALLDFLQSRVRDQASFCYFNYRQSGERIGRALIGFDFAHTAERDAFVAGMPRHGEGFRSCRPVEPAVLTRLTGRT